MGVVVARMVAQLEAETTQFHARMTAAEAQLTKWTSSTAAGRRGAIVLNNALQQLSFQAAGIPGPIGKAASAIGALGAGTGPVMIAVAALGALAIVWKEVDAAATLAADNVVSAANRMQRNIGAATQSLSGRNIAQVEAAIAAQRAKLESLQFGPLGPQRYTYAPGLPPVPVGTPLGDRQLEIQAAETFLNQLVAGLNRMTNRVAGILATEDGAFLPSVSSRKKTSYPDFDFGYGKPGKSPDPREFLFDPLQLLVKDGGKGRRPGLGPEFALMAMMAGVQGAQSGSVGGFLGAAAAPAAMINPLAGLITGAFGSLFSLFEDKESERERNEERRHKELIGAIHEGPARLSVYSANDPASDLYEIRRQERLGGEPRLGGM